MAFPQPNFKPQSNNLEKENEGKSFTPEERAELQKKYLTSEGKGNDEFVNFCYPLATKVVRKIIGNKYPNEVEDQVQETIIRATNSLSQFNGKSSLETWVYKIGRNQALDFLRKMKARPDISQGDSLSDNFHYNIVDSSTLGNVCKSAEALEQVLENLTDYQKHILLLHYIKDLSIEEMARILGVGENTLKVQLFRARNEAARRAKNRELTAKKN